VQSGIRRALDDRSLGSGTAINAALLAAAAYLRQQPERGRRAILLVTDNVALNYQTPDKAVIRELYRADAVLNTILIGKQVHPDPVKPGQYQNPDFTQPDCFKITAETGGEFFEARKSRNAFAAMVDHLRARYALHYEAPPDGGDAFHRIRVELVPAAADRYRGAVLRARAGYYAR
ncbi:MAG TPA: hypothetical protein VG672_13845, partial [Bryobacteraceae bacterium]|nr:hypothetical protein [Bryobacteraceae bacterium]